MPSSWIDAIRGERLVLVGELPRIGDALRFVGPGSGHRCSRRDPRVIDVDGPTVTLDEAVGYVSPSTVIGDGVQILRPGGSL